jgi:hypothetical protein
MHRHRHTGHHRHWEEAEEEDLDPLRELSTRGVLPGPSSFGGKMIGLSDKANSLSDGGVAGINISFGGRCGDMINLSTVSVVGTGGTNRHELGDVGCNTPIAE